MVRGASVWAVWVVVAAPLNAAEPGVRNVSVRGLQIGGTTTLVVDGDALGTAPRLLLPFAAKQTLKPGSNDKQATFEIAVEVEASVPAGYSQLRIVTQGGVSQPVVIGLDRLPQRPLTAAVEQLPAALHGTVSGSATVEAKFQGKAGQKVMVEVEAQRLGSRLRPVLHLYSPKRLQLAWSWPTAALRGDTRLEATLPDDGTYTVAVHDTEYAAAAPGHFRLKIGQWSFVDQVFPPVVGKDQKSVELLGSSSAKIDLPATRDALLPLTWPADGAWSGPRPFVVVSPQTEVVEQPADAKGQQLPEGPIGVSGRLLKEFEEDRYRVPVKPGSRVRFEVFAERLGSPLDVALVVRNEAGNDLARAEDSPGTLDPAQDYAVPAGVTAVVVAVVDAQGRGGPRGVYRLTVDPRQSSAARADFQLVTPSRGITLPVGGNVVVPVLAERAGYEGAIEVSAEGLPAGVKLEGTTIPAGADGALVTVHRGNFTGDALLTRWRGKAENGQERTLALKGHPLERLQPWVATEMALAPTVAKASDFGIDWRGLPTDAGIVPAGKLALPVKVTRTATDAPVRLSLLTSQVPVLVNNQPDPNRTMRVERPVEIAAKATDGDLSVLTPAQLDSPVYDVVVQAELLTADKRSVLATAFTPVRRLPLKLPVVVKLDGPARLEAKMVAGTGTTFDIKGKVERREGFAGDVTINLTGLPPGITVPPVTVKAGTDTFAVKAVLPASVPPGEVGGVKLSGSVAPNPAQANVRVRSREVELTLVVVAASK